MIAEGVSYIHSKKIVHFDLKLDNILANVNANGYITDLCISDFGLSRSFNEFSNSLNFDGSLIYMAPEMFSKDSMFDEKIDCWSLGIILYTILKYELPFNEEQMPDMQNQITNFKLLLDD